MIFNVRLYSLIQSMCCVLFITISQYCVIFAYHSTTVLD